MSTLKYPPGSSKAVARAASAARRSIGMDKARSTGVLASTFILDAPSTGPRRRSRPASVAKFGKFFGARTMMTKTTQPGAEPANVFEDRATPGQWRVEWFDDDGRCELEIFTGHDARRQALRYAMQKYGHFREVQLEQQGEAPRLP